MAKPSLGPLRYYARDNLPLDEVATDLGQSPNVSLIFDLDYTGDGSTFGGIAFEFSANSNSNPGFWMSPRSEFGSGVGELLYRVGIGYAIGHFPQPSAGVHRYVWQIDTSPGATLLHRLWVDGVEQSVTIIRDDGGRSATGFGSNTIFVGARSGRVAPLVGGTTIPQVFARNLTAQEIAAYNTDQPSAKDGYRVTESGDRRTTTSGDSRITQQFAAGASDLAASGALSASATVSKPGAADLTATGSSLTVAMRSVYGLVSLQAAGSLSADGFGSKAGAVSLAATGALTSSGERGTAGAAAFAASGLLASSATSQMPGRADLASTGSAASAAGLTRQTGADLFGAGALSADGRRSQPTQSTMTATGAMSSGGALIYNGSVNLAGAGAIQSQPRQSYAGTANLGLNPARRITEASDYRITEDGNPRINIPFAMSQMTADGTVTIFSGSISAKPFGSYLPITPYAKVDGAYVPVPLVYVKNQNAYQRAR